MYTLYILSASSRSLFLPSPKLFKEPIILVDTSHELSKP